MNVTLYLCDWKKNKECPATNCFHGDGCGDCRLTMDECYAVRLSDGTPVTYEMICDEMEEVKQ